MRLMRHLWKELILILQAEFESGSIFLQSVQLYLFDFPVVFLKELICDRIAASKIYQGENYNQHHPLDYYMKGDINRFIHQNTSNKIVKLLTLLSEEGEDALFSELRNMK